MYEDAPGATCLELSMEELWGRSALGDPIRGTPESVGALTRADVEAHLRWEYIPRRTIISIVAAGDDADDLHDTACRLFADVPAAERAIA